MGEGHSTARSRELGAQLRKRREATHVSGREVARALGWSDSKMSRMESGERGQSEIDVAILLTFCGVRREELDDLLDLARETDESYSMQHRDPELTDELRSLVFQETTASVIENFELSRLPGLTQTENYARALFRKAAGLPAENVEPRVRARLDRQILFSRFQPPHCLFLIHEQALRLLVGGLAVMQEQMLHLLFLSNQPQCEIRVVPTEAGEHAGMGGPFMMMSYSGAESVVCVEHETTSLFLEKSRHTDIYREILASLAEDALDEGHSREFIARLASEYDRAE